jgi:hypothetical protein
MNVSILLASFRKFSFSILVFIACLYVLPKVLKFVVYVFLTISTVVVAKIIKTIDVYYDVPKFLKGSNICLNQFHNYPDISMPLIYSSGLALYSTLKPATVISIVDSPSNKIDEALQRMITDLKDQSREAGLTEKEIRREVIKVYIDRLWDKIAYPLQLIKSSMLRIFMQIIFLIRHTK